MAASAMAVPAPNLLEFVDGTHGDWVTDTYNLALYTSSYVTSTTAYTATNEVATANGYTAKGSAIGTPTLTWDGGNTRVEWDGANVVWNATGAGFDHRYGVIFNETDTTGPDTIVGYIQADTIDVSVSGGNTLTYNWNAEGIWQLS